MKAVKHKKKYAYAMPWRLIYNDTALDICISHGIKSNYFFPQCYTRKHHFANA